MIGITAAITAVHHPATRKDWLLVGIKFCGVADGSAPFMTCDPQTASASARPAAKNLSDSVALAHCFDSDMEGICFWQFPTNIHT
jgi:hypothetical protein